MAVAVEAGEGSGLWLTLTAANGSRLSIVLGPAECVALAADLLQGARMRMGRADWLAKDWGR